MPDSADSRKFNEEEVALIIKRAAELQQTEQAETDTGQRLTLQDVEQIAKEAGIDPLLIRRAAQGIDHHIESIRPSPWLGAPTRIVLERVVDGEIGPEHYESLVNEMRRTFSDNGIPSVLGRTLAWTPAPAGGRRQSRTRNVDISVISRGGVTTIRVEEELRNIATTIFAALMMGGGFGTSGITLGAVMATLGSAAIAGGVWVIVAGGFYGLSRMIFGRIANKREAQLRELISRLADQVRDGVAENSRSSLESGYAGNAARLAAPGATPSTDG